MAKLDQSQSPEDEAYEDLKRRRSDESASRQMFALSGIGFEFIAEVGGLTLLGWWLDRRLGWSPALTLVGVALGFAVGLYRLISFAKRSMK